jgi:purine nucleoside permease
MARSAILICLVAIIVLVGAAIWRVLRPTAPAAVTLIAPKILTVAMEQNGNPQTTNSGEASAWVQRDQLNQLVEISGGNGPVYCNAACDHCLVITGVGVVNATATIMALGLSDKFDLHNTYIMVAGTAGTAPSMATIGAAAWAEYIVYGGLVEGMDPRESGFDWQYLLARLGCTTPWCDEGAYVVGTEVYQLNATLREWAFRLSEGVPLDDNAQAEQSRIMYPQENARRKPFVTKCDALSSATFWAGTRMSDWAAWWVSQQTKGGGAYCMAAFEDTGTLTALTRLAASGRVDLQRVMVLRAASDFDQQHPGQTALQSLQASLSDETGGEDLATENLYRVGSVVNQYIIQHWNEWEKGVPPLQ